MKLKPASLLPGLLIAPPVLAIGLGDLTLHSRLGQPLHATVAILGAPPTLDAECLGLRAADAGIAPPAQARFRIERNGDATLVHITTRHAINDPVAQFVVVSDCEGRLQREYALLLDPPAAIEPATLAASPPPAIARPAAGESPQAAGPAASRPAAPASVALAAATAPPATAAKPRRTAQRKAASPGARLVISGKDLVPAAGGLPAGPEQGASPLESMRQRPAEASAAEISDDSTALNRRLAHLEAQLAALHRRNAELDARRAATQTAMPTPAPEQAPRWPLYLLGVGLLASGGVLASWRRRRGAPGVEQAATILWARPRTPAQDAARIDLDAPLPQLDVPPGRASLPPATVPATADEPEEIPLAATTEGTEVKEDVLDQAEVFVAHGHADLAIRMLQAHLREAPAESPMPWLLLLDLLHREGDAAGYAAASAECRRHFNVAPSPPDAQRPDSGAGLESYPHLLDVLTRAWDKPGLDALFADLVYDRRGGTRVGFEPAAYRDILLLRAIAEEKSQAMAA